MARNGGILNGIYRTSYFVLDLVEKRKNKQGRAETYYRLVDAYGGKDIMYMELTFSGKSIAFNAYTSRTAETRLGIGKNSSDLGQLSLDGCR